jgi:hypothetical protein
MVPNRKESNEYKELILTEIKMALWNKKKRKYHNI